MELTKQQLETFIELIQSSQVLTGEQKFLRMIQVAQGSKEEIREVYQELQKEIQLRNNNFSNCNERERGLIQQGLDFLKKKDEEFKKYVLGNREKKSIRKDINREEELLQQLAVLD